jgi:hypothetical protein
MNMDRPASIVSFERLYLGSIALGAVGTIMNWSTMTAQIAADPNSALLPSWFMPVVLVISFAISLALWYFTARRGAVVAKWILVVFFVIGLLGIPAVISTPGPILIKFLTGVNFVLQALAVWMLFKPDSKQWFAGKWSDGKDIFS